MENHSVHKKDQRISAIITLIVSLVLLLCIYFYRFTRIIPKSEEVVTTMLINFGDNRNGNGEEKPAPVEGSLASTTVENEKPTEQPQPQREAVSKPEPRIITGKDTKNKTVKKEKSKKKTEDKPSKKQTTKKTPSKSSSKNTNSNDKASGDGKGNAAIGNLLRGRGSKSGSQGTGGESGNAGDPLGGDGNGDSKIGVDRKLIAFIPGTMGRGGSQPSHNCNASGEIRISYTVDRSGKVISAHRISGISDPCAVQTTVNWVKKYVKAEKSNTSSTGTYTIRF